VERPGRDAVDDVDGKVLHAREERFDAIDMWRLRASDPSDCDIPSASERRWDCIGESLLPDRRIAPR
jgi:hypothetical protein